jgi:hypothetical protein
VRSTAVSLGVIIPSRLQRVAAGVGQGEYFLERAVANAMAQTALAKEGISITFIVGIDADADVPRHLKGRNDIIWARSDGRSQADALNAGIAAAGKKFDLIAFLEDDDRWDPEYLTWGLAAVKQYGFVSTTQLEVDENDQILRINDFPTPSGWLMPADTLHRIGCFDSTLRWHLDNDWLGRLGVSGIRRCHLVEVTAPTTLAHAEQVRPWIANVIRCGGYALEVKRHLLPTPLVIRMVHAGSGMARIGSDPVIARQSQAEFTMLASRYGRIPW